MLLCFKLGLVFLELFFFFGCSSSLRGLSFGGLVGRRCKVLEFAYGGKKNVNATSNEPYMAALVNKSRIDTVSNHKPDG